MTSLGQNVTFTESLMYDQIPKMYDIPISFSCALCLVIIGKCMLTKSTAVLRGFIWIYHVEGSFPMPIYDDF